MTAAPITKQRRYKSPRAIIRAAKRLIDTGHWTKGLWGLAKNGITLGEYEMLKADPAQYDGICGLCLEGALALCSVDENAYRKATELVDAKVPRNYSGLIELNDLGGRARVLRTLEKALETT